MTGDGGHRVLVVGRSHIYAMRRALGGREDKSRFTILRWSEDEPDGGRFASTAEVIEAAKGLSTRDVFGISYMGMNHTAFGLLRHPEPFDFLEGADDEIEAGATLIPRRIVDQALARTSTKWRMFHTLIKNVAANVVLISVPPPKEDNDYIQQMAATSLGLEGKSIACPRLRLKLWRAEAEMVRLTAARYKSAFLLPPVEALTDEGYLRPEFYEDATHANSAYGGLVLQQLASYRATDTSQRPVPGWAARHIKKWRSIFRR